MEPVKSAQLLAAARVAEALVYAAGFAGVVAGGLLFRQGDLGFAVVAWVLTFIAGAGLRLAAWGVRALAQLLERSARLEEEVAYLAARPEPEREAARTPRGNPDPYRRWGGFH